MKQHTMRTLNLISESKPTALWIPFPPHGIEAGVEFIIPFSEPKKLRSKEVK